MLKVIFQLKGNPNRESLFQFCFGKAEGIMDDEYLIKRSRLLMKLNPEDRGKKDLQLQQINKDLTGSTDENSL